jgi:hypothetical protein
MQYIFKEPTINKIKIKFNFNKNNKFNVSIRVRKKIGTSKELRMDNA